MSTPLTPPIADDDLYAALAVIVLDPKLRAHLEQHDPMALKQAEKALSLNAERNAGPLRLVAALRQGDAGQTYAEVVVNNDRGEEAFKLIVHESLVFPGTINVEVDHDFEDGIAPSARVHYNDALIADTDSHDWREAPALVDDRAR